jgi:hypothetical protein
MYYIQKKQMWIFDDNDKQAARNVSVVDFLTRHYGFSFKRIGHGFRCREHDSLFVKADERTWYWNSQRIGGGNVLKMVEFRMIPLLFSCVNIGEELSAAAITRGLGGEVKRSSVVELKLGIADYILMTFLAAATVIFVVFKYFL